MVKKKTMMCIRLAMLITNLLFFFSKPTPTPISTPVPMVAEEDDLKEENRLGSAWSSHKY